MGTKRQDIGDTQVNIVTWTENDNRNAVATATMDGHNGVEFSGVGHEVVGEGSLIWAKQRAVASALEDLAVVLRRG